MLSCHYTKDLLNLQGVNIINIEHFKSHILIYTQLSVKPHLCPCCKHETSYIHDYRKRKIKDLSISGKHVILIHNHRRYVCKHCGKRFSEDRGNLLCRRFFPYPFFHISCFCGKISFPCSFAVYDPIAGNM